MKKWLEDVEEDIKEMGIICWRRRIQDKGRLGFCFSAGSGPRRTVRPDREREREKERDPVK